LSIAAPHLRKLVNFLSFFKYGIKVVGITGAGFDAYEGTKNAFVIILLWLAALAFSMQCHVTLFQVNDSYALDSWVFRFVGDVMLKGGMPYRDTFDHKGPLLYLIQYLGMRISYWHGIALLEILFLFATFLFFYLIARRFCGRITSFLVVLLCSSFLQNYFEGGNITEEYSLPFIAAAILIFQDYFLQNRISRRRLFLCGLCFAAVLMLRPNMIGIWVGICIAVLCRCLRRKEYKSLFQFILWFVAGALFLILPILIWLAANGALRDFYLDYILFNQAYSHPGLRQIFVAIIAFLEEPSIDIMLMLSLFYWLRTRKTYNGFYFITFMIVLILMSIAGTGYSHYEMVLIPMYIYPVSLFASECESNSKRSMGMGLYVLLIVFFVYAALPFWMNNTVEIIHQYARRGEFNVSDENPALVDIIKENTDEDDKISVIGNNDLLYLLSDQEPATKYSFYPSILRDDYFNELENNRPKLIVVKGVRTKSWTK
jgi:4-amino-4-deoxy-L-arabinose transferase-like glycosyltransferase